MLSDSQRQSSLTKKIFGNTNRRLFTHKHFRIFALVFFVFCIIFYEYLYYNKDGMLKLNTLSKSNFLSGGGLRLNLNVSKKAKITSAEYKESVADTDPSTCSALKKNYRDQYTVKIDGVEYPQYIPIHFDRSINFECLNRGSKANNNSNKLILFWNKFYGDESFYYRLGKKTPFVYNNCPVMNCETTNDKSRLNEADLVVVSMTDGIPSVNRNPRPEKQRWVFLTIESPIHTNSFTEYNGQFNLTATYMTESDFANSYEYQGNYYWKKNESFNDSHDFHSDKIDMVAALISNCGAGTKRLEYINELKKYISVKVYGRCGESCPEVSRITKKKAQCKEIIGTEFKFFLAFENRFDFN